MKLPPPLAFSNPTIGWEGVETLETNPMELHLKRQYSPRLGGWRGSDHRNFSKPDSTAA